MARKLGSVRLAESSDRSGPKPLKLPTLSTTRLPAVSGRGRPPFATPEGAVQFVAVAVARYVPGGQIAGVSSVGITLQLACTCGARPMAR